MTAPLHPHPSRRGTNAKMLPFLYQRALKLTRTDARNRHTSSMNESAAPPRTTRWRIAVGLAFAFSSVVGSTLFSPIAGGPALEASSLRTLGDPMAGAEGRGSSSTPDAPARSLADPLPDPDLSAMEEAISFYRGVVSDGGWDTVPDGPILDPGDRSPRIALVRARLVASGHLSELLPPDGSELYDEALVDGVREFQRTHGLDVDARIGPATLAALNSPAERRLQQLLVNRERQRSFTGEPGDHPGDHYVLVNVPNFKVHIVDQGEESLRLRAIVGQPARPTPVLSARMTYLVLAPFWHVPPGIAARDQLPRIQADPEHIARERMVLLDQATAARIDPYSVEWGELTGSEFNRRYRLRQEPGGHNAMGHVKFMFPNPNNVYLHDTPNRELFDRTRRDFSSGCVRVDQALELVEHFLRHEPTWSPTRIAEVIRLGVERNVPLSTPYQVYIEYWTAFVGDDGTLQFREDIYNRDARAWATLSRGGEIRDLAWSPAPDPLDIDGSCPVPGLGSTEELGGS